MRWFTVAAFSVCLLTTVQAHHPDKAHQQVHPRIDLIPPLGNWLPPSYRRRFNRPTNFGGRIAYHIAPSSLEAMAWHAATHRNAYKDHRPRLEMHYFYPKPWEVLKIGARPQTTSKGRIDNVKSPLPDFESGETLMDALDRTDKALQEVEDLEESLQSTPESSTSPSDLTPPAQAETSDEADATPAADKELSQNKDAVTKTKEEPTPSEKPDSK